MKVANGGLGWPPKALSGAWFAMFAESRSLQTNKNGITNQLMFCTQFGTQLKTFPAQKWLHTWKYALRSLCICHRGRTRDVRPKPQRKVRLFIFSFPNDKCFLLFFLSKKYLNFEKQHLCLIFFFTKLPNYIPNQTMFY